MKSRLFVAVVVLVAFSLAVAGEKGEKSAKSTSAEKSMMHCCEGKDAKACSNKDMKSAEKKEAKALRKAMRKQK